MNINELPPRVKYYLLDYKDRNLKQFKATYGHGSLRKLTAIQISQLWEKATEEDHTEIVGHINCKDMQSPGANQPCSPPDQFEILDRILEQGSIEEDEYQKARQLLYNNNNVILRLNQENNSYLIWAIEGQSMIGTLDPIPMGKLKFENTPERTLYELYKSK